MSTDAAFYPQGPGIRLDVTDVSTAVPLQIQPPSSGRGSPQLMVTNPNLSVNCYLAIGDASAGANGKQIACVAPVVGTPGNGILILANSTQILSYNPGGYVAAKCDTGGSTQLYLYPGEGF